MMQDDNKTENKEDVQDTSSAGAPAVSREPVMNTAAGIPEANENLPPERETEDPDGRRFQRRPFQKPMNSEGGGFNKFKSRQNPFLKKKVCKFCTGQFTQISYKDINMLKRFISDRNKILPRRITGTCAKHQRRVANEIKKARILALIPFV